MADFPIMVNYRRQRDLYDPRWAFARASAGRGIDSRGRLLAYPAGAARFRTTPATGVSEGMLCEAQRTNLLLRSEEFDNASWTKTNCTIGANATTAPDGAVTADSLTNTGVATVSQAATITAGRGIALSVWAKAFATNWLWMKVGDGVNTVTVWFNLATGATGTHTAGGGTCTYSQKVVEAYPNGWYRCVVEVTTATSTAFTAEIAPAAADNTAPANTNSCYAWGAQLEAASTYTNPGSYIPTTSATVTREADYSSIPTGSWFNAAEGTYYIEVVNGIQSVAIGGQSMVWGGCGDSFSNTIYFSRGGNTALNATVISASVGITLQKSSVSNLLVPGSTIKIALAVAANDGSFVVDGAAPVVHTGIVMPVSTARLVAGSAPWNSPSGSMAACSIATFAYSPKRLPDAQMIALTAAG